MPKGSLNPPNAAPSQPSSSFLRHLSRITEEPYAAMPAMMKEMNCSNTVAEVA